MTNPYLSPKEYVETLRTIEEPSGYRTLWHTDIPEEEYVQAQLVGAVSSLELLGAASQALAFACQRLLQGEDSEHEPPDVPEVVSAVAGALESLLPVALEGIRVPGSPDAVDE